jgi:tetratricopeptide (TPR) repeat protein
MSHDVVRLRDEIALREASMADAEKEHAAGELTITEFEAITQRELSALERARRELSDCDEAIPEGRRRRIRRTRWLVVALICFAIVLGYILYASTSPRQEGNSGDGSIALTKSQLIARLLTQGEAEVASGQVVTALNAYQRVLTLDPKNATALTETGWLDFTAGSAAKKASVVELGIKYLEEAITVSPRNPAPRLYFAIVADATPGNQKVATTEFREFLRLKPSAGQMAIAEPFLKTLGLAH